MKINEIPDEILYFELTQEELDKFIEFLYTYWFKYYEEVYIETERGELVKGYISHATTTYYENLDVILLKLIIEKLWD